MNLYSAVQTAYGSRVRRAGIMRRRRNLNTSRRLWEFFTAYADETTKATYVAPQDIDTTTEEGYLRAVLSGQAPLRPEIDYLPFRGRVIAFGRAARSDIYGTHRIEDLSDAERMSQLRKWWSNTTADKPTKAHHVVFTLDPRLAAAMAQADVSADAFLLTAVGNAFTEFQSRFYPGDVLGYYLTDMSAMKLPKKRMFLSHSSEDELLVDKLTDLVTTGCGVRGDEILATTLPGKGIPAGYHNYIEYLQSQIQQPALVVLLLSKNYFASQFCLCELGATWALSLPSFPIVIPPLKKSEIRATLAVTQLGLVDDSEYLDELRDSIKKHLGDALPTATWSTKRDAFLRHLPRVLKKLPVPQIVQRAELIKTQTQYNTAIEDIQSKDEEIEALNAKISDLQKCKDITQVKKVIRKHSSSEAEFERLHEDAKRALSRLRQATVEALFYSFLGEPYIPTDRDDQESIKHAEAIKEVSVDERGCSPDTSHPRVSKAERAVNDLDHFLSTLKDDAFFEAFEEKHNFPLAVSNKEFWDECL